MNINDLLAGIPTNAQQRQRIERLLEENKELKQKVGALEQERNALLEEIERLRAQQTRNQLPPDSIEYHGVRIIGKSGPLQAMELQCCKCLIPLSTPPARATVGMFCQKCGFIADFNRNGLPYILEQLNKK